MNNVAKQSRNSNNIIYIYMYGDNSTVLESKNPILK